MRMVAIPLMAMTLLLNGTAFAALDCAQVKKLHAEGQRPADIARTLGVTTPEVQECMADEKPDEPANGAAASGSIHPLAPHEIPAAVNPVPRGPNQQ